MTKQTQVRSTEEALKLALGYMDGSLVTDHLTGFERKRHVMEAICEALTSEALTSEALKLALEALEICADCRPLGHETLTEARERKITYTITAIREALAEPSEALAEDSSGTVQPQQENQMPKPTRDIPPEPKHLFAKTPPHPAQPQQEPVAWRVFDKDPFDGRDHRWVYFDKSEFVDGIDPTTHFNLEPVYTSPPAQRKPLPGEQIVKIAAKTLPKVTGGMSFVPEWAVPLARAIEAVHNIRGSNHDQ